MSRSGIISYGGQAVIEGVMMRGPKKMAVAVRRPDQSIAVRTTPIAPWHQRNWFFRLPLIRGFVTLIETMFVGVETLMYSASQSAGEEEQLSKSEMSFTVLIGALLAVGIFVVLPTLILGFVKSHLGSVLAANLAEGVVRVLLLVAYVWGISLMKDIQRVLEYHGAEHKTIHVYEHGEPLTVENARKYSTFHPRCGTSFLVFVVLVASLLHAFFGWPSLLARILIRLALLPVVAGVSYEVLKYTGTHDSPWVNWLTYPGLWLQHFTTREPDDQMLEVAIAALENARDHEAELDSQATTEPAPTGLAAATAHEA